MEPQYEPLTLPELFEKSRKEVYEEIERQRVKKKIPRPETSNGNLPGCLNYILNSCPKTDASTFNKLTLNLVTGLQRAGYDHEGAFNIVQPFLEEYSHSTQYTSQQERAAHFNKEWDYIEKNPTYVFDCSYILGLGFPGSAFDCRKCEWSSEQDRPNITRQAEHKDVPKKITSEEILDALESNEDGDARLYIQIHKNKFAYDHASGRWFYWNDHYWLEDPIEQATAGIEKVISLYLGEAKNQAWLKLKATKAMKKEVAGHHQEKEDELRKRIKVLQSSQRKKNVLSLAKVGSGSLGITGNEWDRDLMLLGCLNGVINLRNGSFRPGRPEDFIKTVAPVKWLGPRIPAPEWGKFLAKIFKCNWELISYVKRLLGYALTGIVTEHIHPIFWGTGRNGKGTLLETVKYILGDYVGPIESEMLLQQKFARQAGSPSSDIMNLRGKRLVWASETGRGRSLNTGKLKWVTGNDSLTGREPFGKKQVTFLPTHKLFLLTNNKPHAPADDPALWDRIHLVEFSQSFVAVPDKNNPDQHMVDTSLPPKLKKEAPGILAWLVDGCLEWQGNPKGTDPPECVRTATENYRKEEDILGHYIEEALDLSDPNALIASSAFYAHYKQWAGKYTLTLFSITQFGMEMKKRFKHHKDKRVYYEGIKLLPIED